MQPLSDQSQKLISSYLHLPFSNQDVSCPYFNNRRKGLRGSLRVLIGKGTPDDIVDEAKIISLKKRIDLEKLSSADLKKFLVDNNLGVDCSALVYHILDAEMKARGLKSINNYLKFSKIKNPLRNLLVRFRPVESAGVKTFADPLNSTVVKLPNIQPGDFIVMLNTGVNHDRNHILLIFNIQYPIINYLHSLQWSTDGKYNHGVREGRIEIIDPNKSILEQRWVEYNKTGAENETLNHAKSASSLEIRRLTALQ
jgi:hypothetical protein